MMHYLRICPGNHKFFPSFPVVARACCAISLAKRTLDANEGGTFYSGKAGGGCLKRGGKRHEVPAHYNLDEYIEAYIKVVSPHV